MGEALEAMERDLERIRRVAPELADSVLAASAKAMARELDDPNSATSKSMCARALLDTMDRLRELTPVEERSDALDDLTARRTARRTREPTAGAL
jgi:hypothetical protein